MSFVNFHGDQNGSSLSAFVTNDLKIDVHTNSVYPKGHDEKLTSRSADTVEEIVFPMDEIHVTV